jgi:predicted nucleotidyltransferase
MEKTAQTAPKDKIHRQTIARKQAAGRKRAAAPFADKIPFIRSLILDSVKPGVIKKIYLFGSYAYGKPTKNSDIDLCVVINNRFDDLKTYMKIAVSLYDNGIIPADTLVYKENQFYNATNPNGIKNIILTKGKLLYE